MATATKKANVAASPERPRKSTGAAVSVLDRFLDAVDRVYRFLASLKLAVITLSLLAAALAFATWFESRYGTSAVQDYVYRSAWFAVLLAFLAANILCAALIRFPWKKRQTGFVITHLGLLVLIFGSYWSFKTADEGIVGMLEGQSRNEMVRRDVPVIRVREVDPHTQEARREYGLPFRAGPFAWGATRAQLPGLFDLMLSWLSGGRLPAPAAGGTVLSQPGDPFRLVMKEYLPAAAPGVRHIPDPAGDPMARIQVEVKAPGLAKPSEAFPTEDRQWFKTDRRFYRVARSGGPALVAFSYVDRPEFIEDFLKPPLDAGAHGVARFRYQDRAGKPRVFDLALDGQEGKATPLPESELTVQVEKLAEFPTGEGGLLRVLGEPAIPVAMFKVRKGSGPEVEHFALASLPMVPNIMPNPREPSAQPPQPLVSIHLLTVPQLDPQSNGRLGQIEVLAGPDESLYYRVFGRTREGKTELRSAGRAERGKSIDAFGGGANTSMRISFQVVDYVARGVEKQVFDPLVLPLNQMEDATPAGLLELTVGGESKEVWIQRGDSLDAPSFRPVPFGDRLFEVAYDLDRRPLGFELALKDFEVGFEPGTEQATKFVSQVQLNDPGEGIKGKPYTISMNEPMSHRGYRFYQMRYAAVRDPHTGQPSGQFQSIFQVGIDPGRPIKYAGCMLIVAGIFVQFYMRAGVFSDGGKRERQRAAMKAAKVQGLPPEPAAPEAEEEPL